MAADATQVGQVLMNLVTNASEATGERGGTIRVRTGARRCDDGWARGTYLAEPLPGGVYGYIEVEDDGAGMDEATRSRMFEPFFSTKHPSRGLGLAATLGIVRAHRGAIDVRSVQGEGTAITVFLPACDQAPRAGAELPPPTRAPPTAGTVLLVDDDEDVLAVATLMLHHLDYQVVTAPDGYRALELYRADPDRFDLAVIDVVMPNMSGVECMTELRRLRPEVPVVLSSGYDADNRAVGPSRTAYSAFLKKPYSVEALAAALAEVAGHR